MAKVIAIANQKGGVTKTTTTVNLGIGLTRKGKKVLLIDSDPQGSLTASLGFGEPDDINITLQTIFTYIAKEEPYEKDTGILKHEEGISVMPCNVDMSAFELSLTGMMSREFFLKRYIEYVREDYDYILIDCSPSLGLLTINALTAADSVIIPIVAEYLSSKGMQLLLKSIGMVRRKLNPDLSIEGILISRVDGRYKMSKEIINIINKAYGNSVNIFKTLIPTCAKAGEAPAAGISIFEYDPKGAATKAYAELTEEVIADE